MERSSRPLFSWLHLSDIHFGHGRGAEHEHRELVLDTFLSSLREFERWGTPRPDVVLVTGDIGFSGDVLDRDEYGQAAKWLRQLARGLGLQDHDVYLVPGNHDVARVTGKDAETFQLIQELRTQKWRIDDALHDKGAQRLLVERMRNYLSFAGQFGPASGGGGSWDGLFWSHRLKMRGDLLLRLVGFNTALLANDDTDMRQLWLGHGQLQKAFHQQEENELIIALSHHPPGWLGDGDEVGKWLEARADILLFGHVHEQESLMWQRGGGRRFVQVAAGSLHEVADGTSAPGRFTFSFGAIESGEEGRLQLQVWPFTWTKHYGFRPDLNHIEKPRQYFNVHQLERLVPSKSQVAAGAQKPGAFTEALAAYKRARAEDSRIRRLDLNKLVGITPGPHRTELDLLDFVVAPSLHDGDEEDGAIAARLRRQQRAPNLDPSERREIARKLEQLEQGWWNHQGRHHDDDARKVELISFAEALHRHKRITVIGEPGAGKSVLTRLVLLACTGEDAGARARARLSADDEFNSAAVETVRSLRGLLPVHLTLGKLGREFAANQELSLAEFVRSRILEQKEGPALEKGLGELLGAGRIFLLCDGLDEVPEAQRERVVQELEAIAEHSPEMRILVTSRPHGYHPRVRGFAHTRLAPLHHRQQRVLVSRLHRLVETIRGDDAQGLARAHRRTEALLRAIQTRPEWYELSSNPLLLTLSALTNTNEDNVPKHRVIVFENFVQTILKHWRSTLSRSSEEMNRLLDAWSSVASELVRLELRYGVARGRILRMLTHALEAAPVPAPIDAETALHLALEAGLVREDDETVAFWHSTFAEFLAARFLTGHERGAARRILAADNLSTLVLQLAAARLHHVFDDEDEAAELANGLLARDESRDGRLFRPGLRAVSACLSDGVGFHEDVVERVWGAWVELLEQTPPSPLWRDFYQLTQHAPPARLPVSLAARFARVDDRAVYEVRVGLARIVAPSAGEDASARAACERWLLQEDSFSRVRLHGAFGLACAGAWTETVIEALGRFSPTDGLEPDAVGKVVRRGGQPLLDPLRLLAQKRFASDESPSAQSQENEQGLRELRLSAACLLAAAGRWTEEVTEVMRLTLASPHQSFRVHQARETVSRLCESHAHVRKALLRWLLDESILGSNALEIAREVAPRIEHMPDEVLELTAEAGENRRVELETLLVSIGEERRALVDTLRRWLGDEREERRTCAVRLLRRLAPREHLLHEALRRGLRSQDDAARARWMHLSFGLDDELSRIARETMLECTLSPDPVARKMAYEMMHWELERLEGKPLEAWFARVSAPGVPEAARLDGVKFLSRVGRDKTRVVPLLRELRDTTEDVEIRRETALQLFYRDEVDEYTAAVMAEIAVRKDWSIGRLEQLQPFAATVVPIILRELSNDSPSTDEKGRRRDPQYVWRFVLEKLVAAEPSCANHLVDGMETPGVAGRSAELTLYTLVEKHSAVREVIRERIERAAAGRSQQLSGLVGLGLEHEETRPSALQVLGALDPRGLTQSELEWLARKLYRVKEEQDAARLWRLALDGKDVELSLRAAMALAVRLPDDAHGWLQPTLTRLLGSPDAALRVDAGRIALRCGLLEQEAIAVLSGCLELADQRYTRGKEGGFTWWYWDWRKIVHGPGFDNQMEWLHPHEAQVDLEAMHALCTYRPDVGLPRLTAWLDATEMVRFRSAVVILAGRDGHRDRVMSALEKRLHSAPLEQLGSLTYLVDKHGLYSTEMLERMLARYTSDLPEMHEVERYLADWLQRYPDSWSVLLRQEPARRAELWRLLRYRLSGSHDAISFAVGIALFHPIDPYAEIAELALKNWCTPSKDEKAAPEETGERPPRLTPEQALDCLRQVLSEQVAPTEISKLLRFDRLAELAGLPTERRIEVLLRALDIDINESPGEESVSLYLLEQHVNAGLRLLDLGSSDGRIQPFLESAMRTFAEVSTLTMFQIAYALPKPRLADPSLRRLLIRGTIAPVGYFSRPKQEEMLGLLADAGLSPSELLDVQIACLGLDGRPEWKATHHATDKKGWIEAPQLLDALEGLGCPPERRADILGEFVTRYGETLPTWTKLALAARKDLPDSTAAKLLSSVIAAPEGLMDIERVVEQWQARFAPQGRERRKEDELWRFGEITSMQGRSAMLAELSEMENPALLDEVLTELVAVPGDGLLRLYRTARDSRDSLADAGWIELTNWLSLTPDEVGTARLAKEWLTWGLWRAAEPGAVRVMRSS